MSKNSGNIKRFFILSLLLILFGVSLLYIFKKLKFEESYASVLPVNNQNKFLVELLDNASFFDRMVVHVFSSDSAAAQPKELIAIAEQLSDSIRHNFIPEYIKSIEGKTRPDIQQVIFNNFRKHLPIYLLDEDFRRIDSLISSGDFTPIVQEHLKVLNSPAGYMAAKFIFTDPLGIISKQYSRLENLQVDDNLIVYKNYLLSKDKRHLTFFLIPVDAGNTGKNAPFIENLDKQIKQIAESNNASVTIEYTGSLPIAAANAQQIQRDIQITINMAILVIVLLILYFYRRWQYLGLVLLPAFIGATVALLFFTFYYGKISAISLGIGSVLLGVSVDYALHIFTHLKHSSNIRSVVKDVTLPVLMSSLTTGSAFLGLLALSSPAIRQLGIFAAISVITSALVSVFILPLLLKKNTPALKINRNTFIEKLAVYEADNKNWNVLIILALSVFFIVFIPRVSFEDDFGKLNYMPEYLKQAVDNLDKAGDFSGKKSYLLSEGKTTNEAIDNAQSGIIILDSLLNTGIIQRYNTVLPLVASINQQKIAIEKWNSFWTKEKRNKFENLLSQAASNYHIKPIAYKSFISTINQKFEPASPDSIFAGFDNIASSFKLDGSDRVYLAHVIHLEDSLRKTVSDIFTKNKLNHLIDKKVFFSNMFDNLQLDFDKLLYISLIIVFVIILVFLGRIELALVTFTPILVSWLWTLGIIGLFNIKLNFFNIVICSLIFGLGIDYAIFVTRGLMQKYKTGEKKLKSYKSSILISAFTTLVGLGVLLFAKHPALKSIAALAVVGISSSVFIVFLLQPILFNWLILQKGKLRKEPLTFINGTISVLTILLFIIESILLTITIPLFYFFPLSRKYKKHIFHLFICYSSKFIVWINFAIKKQVLDIEKCDFSEPSVIVSNHQSHLDLMLILRLNPKIIVITNKWVWNNPIYGFIVRYAGFYPIYNGIDADFDKIRKKVSDGYSILIFPEGGRTADGVIKRYHQGAFKLAQELNLDIQPLLIHGAFECLPKTEFFMRSGSITQKFFDKIKVETINIKNNETYRKQAKSLTKLMRNEYKVLSSEQENTSFYRKRLVNQFIYKGPVLEWYVKTKLHLERNYKFLNSVIPLNADIVDIGCGYGYLSLMLSYISDKRNILGIDYDKEKIDTANRIARNDKGINFILKDISKEDIPSADVYILNDVLHYMPEELQINLLNKCFDGISAQGTIIIRDADADLEKRTKVTKVTEIQSTKIFKFNKTKYDLSFISGSVISNAAKLKGFSCERIDNTKHTSNITYLLKHAE